MKFKPLKMIRKGIEGAVLSGGAAEGVIRTGELSPDMDDIERAITVLMCAGAGFIYKAFMNWLKNRKRI